MLVLSCLIFAGTLALIAFKLTSGLTDVVMLFVLVFGLFYGLRPLLMVLGLDTPFPDRFFNLTSASDLAGTTLLWLTAFLVFFAVGVIGVCTFVRPRGSLIFVREEPSLDRMYIATIGLTAIATVISAYMIARYGGVGAFITAVKVDKSLVGLYALKVPAAIGAVVAMATLVQMRGQMEQVTRRKSIVILMCGILNGFSVFIWGQRSTLVVVGVILLIGLRKAGPQRSAVAGTWLRLLLAVAVVFAISSGLRVARDTLIQGEVQDVVAEANVWRQASLATNSIYFDSSMLAFRDWPDVREYRLGVDFATGATGLVPRAVWAGKPSDVTIGRTFRAYYQPQVVNGWPVGAPTLWWLNFGPLGVLLGGLVSGIGFGWLRSAQRNSSASGFNLAVALVTAVYVFQTGISSQWPVYFAIWTVPLLAVKWFVTPRGNTVTREPASPPSGPEVGVR